MALPPKRPAADEQLRARAEGRTYTSEEIQERAKVLEAKLAQLKNRHDQFFLGLDRQPLAPERAALRKELETLRSLSNKNTALKFHLNALFNKFLSYERMWMRTERDIEDGRHRPDLFKARLHQQRRTAPEPASPAEPTAPATGPNDRRIREIYDALISAKRECNEPVGGITLDQIAQRLRAQLPALVQQAKGKAIDFKVVIQDGKATLRAVTKT